MNVFYLGPCSYEQPETSMPSKEYEKRQKAEREKLENIKNKLTAKEMFEKLQYREIITKDGNYVYEKWGGAECPMDIIFYVKAKFITVSFGQRRHHFYNLDNKELDAIEKKRKELGWAKCTCRRKN